MVSPSPVAVVQKPRTPLHVFFLRRDKMAPKGCGLELLELEKRKSYFKDFPYETNGISINKSDFEIKISEILDPVLLSNFFKEDTSGKMSYLFYLSDGAKQLPVLLEFSDTNFPEDLDVWKALASTSKRYPLIITPRTHAYGSQPNYYDDDGYV